MVDSVTKATTGDSSTKAGTVDSWTKATTLSTVLSALFTAAAAGAAAWAAWTASGQQIDARRLEEAKAIAGLSNEGMDLYGQIDHLGVSPEVAQRLAAYFYALLLYKKEDVVTDQTYKSQVKLWCDLTQRLHDKLDVYWIKNETFVKQFQGDADFIELIKDLTNTGAKSEGICK